MKKPKAEIIEGLATQLLNALSELKVDEINGPSAELLIALHARLTTVLPSLAAVMRSVMRKKDGSPSSSG